MGLVNTLSFIWRHPLSRGRRWRNIGNLLAWQIGARLVPGPVVVPLAGGSQLLGTPGMTAATGHIYVGLQDFEDMAFVVHLLREHDWFVDVGANIGGYSILAAKVAKANVVAFEPADEARDWLSRNVELNSLTARVEVRAEAVGSALGQAAFTIDSGTTNSIVPSPSPTAETARVEITTLDLAMSGRWPTAMKIDVEGYETEVIKGSGTLLQQPCLLALIIELNNSGAKYGYDETALVASLNARGFERVTYDPFSRSLRTVDKNAERLSDNVIFVRDLERVNERLQGAITFNVRGWKI